MKSINQLNLILHTMNTISIAPSANNVLTKELEIFDNVKIYLGT